MWFTIAEIEIKQVSAAHVPPPRAISEPMVLRLYQQEATSAFFVSRNKKIFTEYRPASGGKALPKLKWSSEMNEFAQDELAKIPPTKSLFKVTVLGWFFLLFAFGILGYLSYQSLQAPAKHKAFEQKMAKSASVAVGDIYFGNYRRYKEKGNMLGSEGGFGWFKVTKIESDTYHIAKSTEISKTAKPKEQMNSTDFETQASPVKAKELEAYTKHFLSEEGLLEFNLFEQK